MPRFSSYRKYLWIVIALLSLSLISPARLSYFQYSMEKIRPAARFPGTEAEILQTRQSADLDRDGKEECVLLAKGVLTITDCEGGIFWQSPQTWQVKEAKIGDLNRDGRPEVDLLVWRPFAAWPIDKFVPAGGRIKDFHDAEGMSCHVILIGWTRGGYNELWAGSALIRPVDQLFPADLDGDGYQELAALEGQYDSTQAGGDLTVWKWDGFGFVLVDDLAQNYRYMKIIGTDSERWILVQK